MTDWHKPLPERLPQPSYAPPLMAAGLTLLLWGVLTSWIVSVTGLVLTGVAAALWIGNVDAAHIPAPALAAPEEPQSPRAAAVKPASQAISTPWLHRTAVLLAVATLTLIFVGAGVTNQAGQSWEVSHVVVAAIAGVLTVILAVLLRNPLGWTLLAATVVQAMGYRDPVVGALHAFLAQMFFAATVAVALMTSNGWKRPHEIAQERAKPSLGTLSVVTFGLVVAQVALGAAVRHKLMGSGIHITAALLVALAIVVLGALVTNQFPTDRRLRPAAVALMVIAGAQVFLGFGAFIVRMMADENSLAVRIATMAHVTIGALTLASTLVLVLEIRRNLRSAASASADVVQP